MTEPQQSCGSCLFGQFERTPTGRIKQKKSGQCTFEVPQQPLPDSITKAAMYVATRPKSFIWPKDGETCPCYVKLSANQQSTKS